MANLGRDSARAYLGQRAFLALVLATSSILKVLPDPAQDGLLPGWALWLAAGVEAAAGALLLCSRWRIGAFMAAASGAVFCLSVPAMILLGFDPSRCGCFGPVEAAVGVHLAVAAGILLIGCQLAVAKGLAPDRSATA